MSININSEASCRKAYLNYHCYGNTMGITATEMGEITATWKDKLKSWQNTVSQDENEYEFDDSEFESSRSKGKKVAQEATDYDGDQTGQIMRTTATNIGSAGSLGASLANNGLNQASINLGNAKEAVTSKLLGKKVTETVTKDAAGNITSSTTSQTTRKVAEKGAENGSKASNASAYIAAGIAIATAIAYRLKKPNKEQKEACDTMQTELTNAQGATQEAQSEMESMSDELIDLSDEANTINEDANGEIENKKTEYDMYKSTYEALKAKVDSGEQLTEEEKALYKEVVGYLTATGEEISDITDETGDTVQDIYDDMGSYQEGYDYAAETIGEIEGQTDFAASFDKSTQKQCYTEIASQSMNAASGAIAGARLLVGPWWQWVIGAASIAAGTSSAFAAIEQGQWAGQVGNEIEVRKDTQDLNAATLDTYTEEVDSYDGFMSGVEDLELDIPDDVSAPKDTALPETKTPTDKTDVKKDKEEK